MQDNVTAAECRGWLMRITLVLKRKPDILSISFQFISQKVIFLLTFV